jgi:hypothetical protein
MPDQRTPEEQLQPALLDRLTDEEPDKKLEPRRERVMSKRRMRDAVLRDLAWLFNTTRLDPDMDPVTLPYARRVRDHSDCLRCPEDGVPDRRDGLLNGPSGRPSWT